MSKTTITIRTRKPKLMTCDVCGKTDKTVGMYCGGPFTYLCPSCDKLAVKIIQDYLSYLSYLPFHIVAATIAKHYAKTEARRKTQ